MTQQHFTTVDHAVFSRSIYDFKAIGSAGIMHIFGAEKNRVMWRYKPRKLPYVLEISLE